MTQNSISGATQSSECSRPTLLFLSQLFRLHAPLEMSLAFVGVLASVVLGLTIPSAVFLVGEVVTLFITNRRARLAVLQMWADAAGKDVKISDHSENVDKWMEDLDEELEDAVAFNNGSLRDQSRHIFASNRSLQDDVRLNEELNTQFLTSLHAFCYWMLLTACVQWLSGYISLVAMDFSATRSASRWRNFVSRWTDNDGLEAGQQPAKHLLKDITVYQNGAGRKLAAFLTGMTTLLSCLSLAFWCRWQLALILSPIPIIVIYGRKIILRFQATSSRRLIESSHSSEVHLQETLERIRLIHAFGQQEEEVNRYASLLAFVQQFSQTKAAILSVGNGLIVTTTTHMLNVVMLWYGVRLVLNDMRVLGHPFLPGTLVLVFFCFLRGLLNFNLGWVHADAVRNAIEASERIQDALHVLNMKEKGFLSSQLYVKLKPLGDRQLRTDAAIQRLAYPADIQFSFLRARRRNKRPSIAVDRQAVHRAELLESLQLEKSVLIWGCFGSVVLGAIIPLLFYFFCEIIGAMANLDDETVYRRTTVIGITYATLGASCLLGTFLQQYMNDKVAVSLGNKLRTKVYAAIMAAGSLNEDEMEDISTALDKSLKNDVPAVEKAVRSVFGSGLQILWAVILSVPLGASVIWEQALLLSWIIPGFFSLCLLKSYFANKIPTNPHQTFPVSPKVYRHFHLEGIFFGIFQAIREFCFSTILFFGGHLIVHNGVSNKDVLQVNLVIINPALLLGQVVAAKTDMQLGWNAALRIVQLTRQISRLTKLNDAIEKGKSLVTKDVHIGKSAIEFHEVHVVDSASSGFSGISLTIRKGVTAIIMEHMEMKDLFTDLLLQKHEPDVGLVTISGIDITELPGDYILREVHVTSGMKDVFSERTIADNLTYGVPSTPFEKVLIAAKKFGLHDTVMNFQKGYESKISEVSIHLSTEDIMRLIYIRSFLYDPEIMIVDEAYLPEDFVDTRIDKICIIIGTSFTRKMRNANQIFIIQNGKCQELTSLEESTTISLNSEEMN